MGDLQEQVAANLVVMHLVSWKAFAIVPLLKEGVQIDIAEIGNVIFEVETISLIRSKACWNSCS